MLRSQITFSVPARRGISPVAGVALSSTLGAALLIGATVQLGGPQGAPPRQSLHEPTTVAASPDLSALFDPRASLAAGLRSRWPSAPLASTLELAPAIQTAAIAPPPARQLEPARPVVAAAPAPALLDATRTAEAALLPPPRPTRVAALDAVAPDTRVAARPAQSRSKTAASPAPAADTRNFLEKLFGVPTSTGTTYAALDGGALPAPPAPKITPMPVPAISAGGGTAIYDISAQTVTLPGGERLEAHSGLGEKLDDPRFVHVRMRGATPPGTYELTEREALFHGVRAIRLNPVGGSGAVHGRAGLLAHTYMLGPNGQSNGCVSLRDYDRFLQAFLRGEIRRLVVVAGSRQDGPLGIFNRRFGGGKERRQSDNARDA